LDWYGRYATTIVLPPPNHMNVSELEARGLIIKSSRSGDFDARYAPHGSTVARVWERIGGGGKTAYPVPEMVLIRHSPYDRPFRAAAG
jgi:hypothetical protein